MKYTPTETKILIDFYRRHRRAEFDPDEERERLQMELERLQDNLQRFGMEMSYTSLLIKKRRIREISEILFL